MYPKFYICNDEELNKNTLKKENVNLPKRATKSSAGYDFFSPFDFTLKPGETIKVPTGIKAYMPNNLVLLLFPRSSLGFKYRLQLDNTVGVVDADYFENENNDGHIFIKITNDSKNDQVLFVKQGDAFAQGIFIQYFITADDNTLDTRIGGFGSTNK